MLFSGGTSNLSFCHLKLKECLRLHDHVYYVLVSLGIKYPKEYMIIEIFSVWCLLESNILRKQCCVICVLVRALSFCPTPVLSEVIRTALLWWIRCSLLLLIRKRYKLRFWVASQVLRKWKANTYGRLCLDSLANAAGLPQLTRLIVVQSSVLPLD